MKKLLPSILFLIIIIFSELGLFNQINQPFSDLFLKHKILNNPLEISPKIVPIDLNDRAVVNLQGKVNSREAFALLFSLMAEGYLKGGMDFIFSGYKNNKYDRIMADSIKEMDNLCLAIVPLSKEQTGFSGNNLSRIEVEEMERLVWHPEVKNEGLIPVASSFLLPNRELLINCTSIGHIGLTVDSDGLYRKSPLFYRWGNGYIPSFALSLAVNELNIKPESIIINAGSDVTLTKNDGIQIKIPIDKQGNAIIPYPSEWNAGWDRIPLDNIVAKSNTETGLDYMVDYFTGSIMVVGDITTEHKDFGSTPFESVYPLSGIHTSFLNGILTNTFYREQNILFKILIYLTMLLLINFITKKLEGLLFHTAFIFLSGSIYFINFYLWFSELILPNLAGPLLGVTAVWLYSNFYQALMSYKKNLLLESALGRYFPKSLVTKVLKSKTIDLKSTNKELTILFSDIAGFTKWSSDKSPELVHSFLDEYFDLMTNCLFKYGGTVDKFIGDGILAFFGDPLESTDHYQKCIEAAEAMQQIILERHDTWQDIYSINLKVRIGINSGRVLVGNLGTKSRIEYTVIGSAVNLAQRMESNAPLGEILISQNTWEHVKHLYRCKEVKNINAKGYDRPIPAYVLNQNNNT